MLIIYAILAGVSVGFMSSVLGVGGGIIMVPVLNLIFGFEQQAAVATSLATICLITLFNTIRFQIKEQINWHLVFSISIFSLIASFLSGTIATHLSEKWLILGFVLFVFFLAWRLLWATKLKNQKVVKQLSKLRTSLIGLLSGTISGFAGVGGGAVITPLLISTKSVEQEKIVPVSNTIMFLTALSGVVAFILPDVEKISPWQIGYVHTHYSFIFLATALPVAFIGTRFQHRLNPRVRAILLGVILLVIALQMLVKWYTMD